MNARGILRYPTTVGFIVLVSILGVVAEVFPGQVSYTFITEDALQFIVNVTIAAVLMAIGERLCGSIRAALIYVIGGALGVTAGVGFQRILFLADDMWGLGEAPAELLDPISPALAVALAGSAFATALWRRRLRVIIFALVILFSSYASVPADLYRLTCAVVGLVIGIVLVRGGAQKVIDVSPRSRRRRFLTSLTAVTALGPLLAMLRPAGLSPLAILSAIATGETIDTATVLETCGLGSTWACERGLLVITNHGVGTSALSFVPVLLLLLSAWGMWRGSRFALYLAVTVNVCLSFIAAATLNIPVIVESILYRGKTLALPEFTLAVFLAVVLPLVMSITLLVNRGLFSTRTTPSALRHFWITTGICFTALFTSLLFWSIAFAQPTRFTPTAWYFFAGTLKRFLPGRLLDQPRPLIIPTDIFGAILYQVVGPLFWLIFIIAAIRLLLSPQPFVHETRRERAFELVKRGGSSLSYMTMWPGNNYWFSPDGEAFVAYRVIHGVALTLADPVCEPGEELRRMHEFTSFCDRHHWIPVFYSVHAAVLPACAALGWHVAPVGQESHLLLAEIDLASKEWQKIRHAHNRAGREEVTAVWTTWAELSPHQHRQVEHIADGWSSTRKIPEMGFTLGTAAELRDPHIQLMLAIDSADRIHGITSWLPVYRNGLVVGWTLDFMRRSGDALPGVMEFLIGSTALQMKEAGVESLSLSGVPLAKKPLAIGEEVTSNSVLDRIQAFLSKRLEPAYGFESLMFFKSKFHPHYETLYMTYADPVSLPRIARAIGRAYLPDVTTRGALKLLWRLQRDKKS